MSGIGSGHVYAKAVFDNNYPKSDEMAAKFSVPTCVINASWSEGQQSYGKKYVETMIFACICSHQHQHNHHAYDMSKDEKKDES